MRQRGAYFLFGAPPGPFASPVDELSKPSSRFSRVAPAPRVMGLVMILIGVVLCLYLARARVGKTAALRPGAAGMGRLPVHVWHRFTGSFTAGTAGFDICLPDPQRDHNTRVILSNWYEDALGDVFRVVLSGRCSRGTGKVIDIGSNLGIFSATSAAFGCDVLAVEAQSRLVPFIAATAQANGWAEAPHGGRLPGGAVGSTAPLAAAAAGAFGGGRLEVRNVGVYDVPGALSIAYYTPLTNASGWLSMAMDKESLAACPTTPGCSVETVAVVEASSLVEGDTVLVKVDVDGPEARIVKSLLPALSAHAVDNVMVEACPQFWRDIPRDEGLGILRRLPELGYDVVLLDQIAFTEYKPGFLDRCALIEGVFRPKAYHMPAAMFDELFEDGTTSVNCKNVLFTKQLHELVARFPGGIMHPPHATPGQ